MVATNHQFSWNLVAAILELCQEICLMRCEEKRRREVQSRIQKSKPTQKLPNIEEVA